MSFAIKRVEIGRITIPEGKTITATDPCYDKDVWCRKDGIEVDPGEYVCYIYHGEEEPDDGDRVWIIGIEKVGARISSKPWQEIAEIGVDAGLAGFFIDKPDYSDEEWRAMCDEMFAKPCSLKPVQKYDAYLTETGFWSESGYGDGAYGVFAKKKTNGLIAALEIRF